MEPLALAGGDEGRATASPRERKPVEEPQPGAARALVDFDAIFEDVFPPLFRYCHRLTGDADAAEDVTQEAFVRLLTREVEGHPAGLRVWLFRVATHLIRDRYRVSENRRRLLEKHPVVPSGAPDPHQELERSETAGAVRSALATLQERDREMLLMREEGFSYREIAEAVDVQPGSVGTLLARAQKRFNDAYRKLQRNTAGSESPGWEDHEPLG